MLLTHTDSIVVDNEVFPVLNLPGRPRALLDKTVAQIYQVNTREINQAVKNNPKKFPEDFCFQLKPEEINILKEDNNLNFSWTKGYYPKAFNHYGCNMLSTVIRSDVAIKRSIEIIKAFTLLEKNQITRNEQWDLITAKIIAAITNKLDDLRLDFTNLRLDFTKKLFALEERITKLEKIKVIEEVTLLEPVNLSAKQEKTLAYARKYKKITNKDYRELFNLSQSTATRELNEMVKLSLLEKHGCGRGTFYCLRRL